MKKVALSIMTAAILSGCSVPEQKLETKNENLEDSLLIEATFFEKENIASKQNIILIKGETEGYDHFGLNIQEEQKPEKADYYAKIFLKESPAYPVEIKDQDIEGNRYIEVASNDNVTIVKFKENDCVSMDMTFDLNKESVLEGCNIKVSFLK